MLHPPEPLPESVVVGLAVRQLRLHSPANCGVIRPVPAVLGSLGRYLCIAGFNSTALFCEVYSSERFPRLARGSMSLFSAPCPTVQQRRSLAPLNSNSESASCRTSAAPAGRVFPPPDRCTLAGKPPPGQHPVKPAPWPVPQRPRQIGIGPALPLADGASHFPIRDRRCRPEPSVNAGRSVFAIDVTASVRSRPCVAGGLKLAVEPPGRRSREGKLVRRIAHGGTVSVNAGSTAVARVLIASAVIPAPSPGHAPPMRAVPLPSQCRASANTAAGPRSQLPGGFRR